jgi:hypothetical protein
MKKPVSSVAFVLTLAQAAENQRSAFDMLRACPEFIEEANQGNDEINRSFRSRRALFA